MAQKPETILKKLKSIFMEEQTKLEEVKTKDGATIFAEMFEAGEAVFIVDGEERVPLPIGEYELEDGRMLVVEDEGIIASISEKAEAEPEEEAPAEDEALAAEKEKIKNIMKEILADLQKEEMQKMVDEMQAQVNQMKSDLSNEITEAVTELSKLPAGDAPKSNPKGKVVEAKLGSTGRPLTTQEKIYARLFKDY